MGLLNNAKWLAFAQCVKVFCQLVSLIFLARLVAPSEYGLMAMAGVVVALGFLFRDMGTSAALIQRQELTEDLKNAVFWLNIITGSIIALLIVAFSPVVADYFKEPRLVSVLLFLSFSFPITCFSASHLALMERQCQFKKIAYIEAGSSLIATVIAIILAYKGLGVYSLVAQSLINSILSTSLIFTYSNWRPSIHGYRYLSEIKKIFMFSGNLVAFNFINYFSRNADRYIVGRFMTSPVLGAYDLGYKIMLFPLQTLTFVVSRSILPVLSSHQNDEKKFNDIFLNALTSITFISFPLMIGIMALREPFVNLVFGTKWQMVTSILLWLAPTGMLQSMNSTTGAVLTAKGKTNLLLYTGVMSAVIYVGCFFLSAKLGIVDFSKNYFYSNILAVGLNLAVLCYCINMRLLSFIKSLMPATFSSALMWFALFFLKTEVSFYSSWSTFIFLIFSGAAVYILSYICMPGNFILRSYMRRRGL